MIEMTMSSTRLVANLVSDLKVFAQVCAEMEGPQSSLAQIARKIGQSTSGLSDCLERLKNRYGGEPLIDTIPKSKSLKITPTGEVVIKRANEIFKALDDLGKEARDKGAESSQRQLIRVGASPFILATLFPGATKGFLAHTESKYKHTEILFTLNESYDFEGTLELIKDRTFAFAVLWDFPGRSSVIRRESQLTCNHSAVEFEASVIFGNDHKFKTERLESRSYQWVNINELASELVYVMEKGHRPLEDMLPLPERELGGDRVEMKNLASIIGSIRAGVPGVSIVPAIHREFDKYRRDGSAFLLPLRDDNGNKLYIKMLYVYRGNDASAEKPDFTPDHIDIHANQMEEAPREFLKFLEGSSEGSLRNMVVASGWRDEVDGRDALDRSMLRLFRDIRSFTHIYHLSSTRMGIDIPLWHHSEIDWKSPKRSDDSKRQTATGELKTTKGVEVKAYRVEAEMIGAQVILIKAYSLDDVQDRDCFSINFNMANADGSLLIGMWSGRDDKGSSPTSGPCILSQCAPERVNMTDVKQSLHVNLMHIFANTDNIFFDGGFPSSIASQGQMK